MELNFFVNLNLYTPRINQTSIDTGQQTLCILYSLKMYAWVRDTLFARHK